MTGYNATDKLDDDDNNDGVYEAVCDGSCGCTLAVTVATARIEQRALRRLRRPVGLSSCGAACLLWAVAIPSIVIGGTNDSAVP